MPALKDEFYVGYQPSAAPGLRRLLRKTSLALLLLAALVALWLVLAQNPFDASRFEFGVYKPFEGRYSSWPYPALITASGRFLLVAPGKHGASIDAAEGASVSFDASPIERGQDRMLQVVPESVKILKSEPSTPAAPLDLGTVTLTGEVVDTKCHFGVMNPGSGKVHRDCAALCIRGGIPPGLLVRDATGAARTILLVGVDGRRINNEILPFAGERVTAAGALSRVGPTLVLRLDPASISNFQ